MDTPHDGLSNVRALLTPQNNEVDWQPNERAGNYKKNNARNRNTCRAVFGFLGGHVINKNTSASVCHFSILRGFILNTGDVNMSDYTCGG